jgi:hypothetical protein
LDSWFCNNKDKSPASFRQEEQMLNNFLYLLFVDVCNKLECMSIAGLSNLV